MTNDDHRRLHRIYNKMSIEAIGIAPKQVNSGALGLTVGKLRSAYMDLLNEIEVRRRRTLLLNGDEPATRSSSSSSPHRIIKMKQLVLSSQKSISRRITPPLRPEAVRNAWLMLSATGEGGGYRVLSTSIRDDTTAVALRFALECQTRLVNTLRSIGEIVVYGEQNVSSDPTIFDYFCEKRMIALLVDIVRAKPILLNTTTLMHAMNSNFPTIQEEESHHDTFQEDDEDSIVTNLMPVAYTAPVKAQVLQTISLLISNAKDPTSLYYLLSNNHINLLLCSLLPLKQFTTASQEEIIPIFTGLLKNLTIHLVQSPSALSQFFFLPRKNKKKTSSNQVQQTKKTQTTKKSSFPLLSAAVDVATSAYARSDSFVRLTALNIINNICGLLDESIHALIDDCVVEQQLLFTNLCQRLAEQYQNLASAVLTTSSTFMKSSSASLTDNKNTDATAAAAVTSEVLSLLDQLHFLNSLFQCGVRSLNVRLCEWILRYVIFDPLMAKIASSATPSPSAESSPTAKDKYCTEKRIMAQVASYVLSQIMLIVDYKPFSRMCAVAILHPLSPAIAGNVKETCNHYAVTQALNDIVQSVHRDSAPFPITKNKCRESLFRLLMGIDGDSTFITAVMLMQSIIDCDAVNDALLAKLAVLPNHIHVIERADEETNYKENEPTKDLSASSHLEQSLYEFLSRETQSISAVKCAGSLGITLTRRILRGALHGQQIEDNKRACSSINIWFDSSLLIIGLRNLLLKVAEKVYRFRHLSGLSNLFVEILQDEIQRWYSFDQMRLTPALVLSFRSSDEQSIMVCIDYLVKVCPGLSSSDIDDARETIRLFLLLRSLNMIFTQAKDSWNDNREDLTTTAIPSLIRERDNTINETISHIGGMHETCPAIGSEIDLKGKPVFPFVSSWGELDELRRSSNSRVRRHVGDSRRLRVDGNENGHFLLVIDLHSVLVVKKTLGKDGVFFGTIICGCLMRHVLASATENDWLYIVIRQGSEIGIPLECGSMAFRFFNVGTCLVARKQLEKQREAFCEKLLESSDMLFNECSYSIHKDAA